MSNQQLSAVEHATDVVMWDDQAIRAQTYRHGV